MTGDPLAIIDVLKIPQTTQTPFGVVSGIATYGLLPLLFIISLLTEHARGIKGEQPEYFNVIYIAVAVTFGLLIYRLIFMKIVALCEAVGMGILSPDKWATFKTALLNAQTEHSGGLLVKLSPRRFLLTFSLYGATIIEDMFNAVRFIFLCALYVVGPLAFVFAVLKPTRTFFKGWLLSTFQVSFWIVIFRIFQSIMASFQLESAIEKGNMAVTLIITITFLLMLIFTPMFTSRLLSGQNIGLVGTAIIGMGAFMAGGRLIRKGVGAIGGAAGKVIHRLPAPSGGVLDAEPKQQRKR